MFFFIFFAYSYLLYSRSCRSAIGPKLWEDVSVNAHGKSTLCLVYDNFTGKKVVMHDLFELCKADFSLTIPGVARYDNHLKNGYCCLNSRPYDEAEDFA